MSFANQALCAEFVAKSAKLETKVYVVPKEIDEKIAELKLDSMGIKIDRIDSGTEKVSFHMGNGNNLNTLPLETMTNFKLIKRIHGY